MDFISVEYFNIASFIYLWGVFVCLFFSDGGWYTIQGNT